MKRFWISWEQLTEDYRPLSDPPPIAVAAWWRSGQSENAHILCAIVHAESEKAARVAIRQAWDASVEGNEVGEFRFVEAKADDWLPGNRFPISRPYEKERLGL